MTKRSVVLAWVLLGGLAAPGTADVFISEFMAVNNTTLQDEDGAYPDWLELFNAGSQSVDLEGWFLTDSALNLYKWRFPAVSIAPGQFLVVFCSGKDRTDPAAELHTSFRLRGDGEYLALVGPDGLTVVHAYEGFPEQVADVSYGLSQEVSSSVYHYLISNIFLPLYSRYNTDFRSTWSRKKRDL